MSDGGSDRATDWQILGLHHVAFAHSAGSGVEAALDKFLGLRASHEESGEGFTERMLPVAGDCYVQLLESTGDGVVKKFVSQRGSALHHVAFEVTGIEDAVMALSNAGARLIDERPRPGGEGTRIAFVHPSSFGGLLVELVERL